MDLDISDEDIETVNDISPENGLHNGMDEDETSEDDDITLGDEYNYETQTFEEDPQTVLEDICRALRYRISTVPADKVKQEWSRYLQIFIKPSNWQAIWLQKTHVTVPDYTNTAPSPNPCLVEVVKVDFDEFMVEVKILAPPELVKKDIFVASLLEIYPTKEFEKREEMTPDSFGRSYTLYILRFFYNCVWMPWDEDNDCKDWLTEHLEMRIQLYCDLHSGKISEQSSHHMYGLIRNARSYSRRIKELTSKMDKEEDFEKRTVEYDKEAAEVIRLNLLIGNIQREMDILENPALRSLMERYHYDEKQLVREKERAPELLIVCPKGPINGLQEFINLVELKVKTQHATVCFPSLQDALDYSVCNDIICLPPGTHSFANIRRLEDGGTIMGLSSPESTVICSKAAGDILLVFSYGEVKISNLTIALDYFERAIMIQSHCQLHITNCLLKKGEKMLSYGILVLSGGKVYINQVKFEKMNTGMELRKDSMGKASECHFDTCGIGGKIHILSQMELTKCFFKECGLLLDSDVPLKPDEKLDDIFLKNPALQIESNTFEDVPVKNQIVLRYRPPMTVPELRIPISQNEIIEISDTDSDSSSYEDTEDEVTP